MTEQTRTILYLDDEPLCLDIFRQMFEQEHEIRTAMTVAKARHALSERAADIVISDQSMPDIEGINFLREVATLYPTSCRAMLTGNVSVGDMLDGISNGVVDLFMAKPRTAESISQALKRASIICESRETETRATVLVLSESHKT
jgi:DNA-binding NtrC family response regulator